MFTRPGTTLYELIFALVITAIVATMALPSMLHARRVLAVRAARADLAAAIATARSAAVLTGGAAVTIDVAHGMVWVETGDGRRIGDAQPVAARHGVTLEADRTSITLQYDALGIGRLANASIRVRRGDVAAALTVSAYGRVRL